MRRLLLAGMAAVLVAGLAPAAATAVPSPDAVVAEVYGGGGNSGATLTQDFIELGNRGTAAVDLTGWSVQYLPASPSPTSQWQVTPLTGALQPNKRYLIAEARGAGGTVELPTPDAAGTIAMSATAGTVALVNTTTRLTCLTAADCVADARIRDLVGYGNATVRETIPAPTASNTTSVARGDSLPDTDNNAADFTAGAPTPQASGPEEPPPTDCDVPATHQIAQVQGSGDATPLASQAVRVEGVVTGDFQGSGQLGGFFLQDDSPDADPATSDGLFAFTTTPVAAGDRVLVSGTAIEFNGLTELSPVTSVDVCGTGTIAEATVDLPRAEGTTFERLENVAVTFPEALTATEHFQLGRFGEVTVSSDGRLFQPTDGHGDTQAENDRRRLLIDDGSTAQNPPTVPYTSPEVLRLGDTVTGATGVLSFGFGLYRLQPTETVSFTRANPRPASPAPVGGDIRVASFNTLNWSTTLGDRGADTAEERDRQLAKLVDAITGLDADVLGLMEVENNGGTAVGALVDALNAEEGAGTYAHVGHPSPGTDAIKVEIIYKPAAVAPVGTPPDTSDPIHNRNPLVQTFERTGGSERFTVVVNHFKSKNCDDQATGGDADQGDGQGCYNARRVAQANRLLAQLAALDVPNPLILGDLNAYTEEDPIHAIEGAGFTGLSELFVPEAQRYSFVFDGQSGELDHALAASGLLDNVSGTTIWHINADEPLILDYNTEFNPPGLYQPNRYRSSDHDPLLVGLDLARGPAVPAVSALAGWGALTASWQPGDDGGSPITGYEVRVLARGAVVASRSLGPDARSATFGDLENGVPHTIEVVARNAVGDSDAGTATATPFVPRRYTRLDARPGCPAFSARNPNAFPVSVSWTTSRGQTGTDVVPAGATVTLGARAPRGITLLALLAGRQPQDVALAYC